MEGIANKSDRPRVRFPLTPPSTAKGDLPAVFGQAIEYESGAREIAHTHPRAQLLYATTGLIRVRTPAANWMVTPDCAMLIPPRVEHELQMVGKVGFRTLYVDPCPDCGDEGRLLPVDGLMRAAILAMVCEPVHSHEPGSLADILTQLIVNLLGTAVTAEEQPGRLPIPQHPRLRRICEALIEAPANGDSLERWGDRFGASSRTLARHFQRETGMPFAKWREQMRVSEAMCLLSTHTPIDEVARYLGYGDANSFAVMFKRVLQMTPLKYQSMMCGG
jgi:AraC-like DNA-binding protein/quercetin dioxygenase-like cupin family protein